MKRGAPHLFLPDRFQSHCLTRTIEDRQPLRMEGERQHVVEERDPLSPREPARLCEGSCSHRGDIDEKKIRVNFFDRPFEVIDLDRGAGCEGSQTHL